ncbi:hypothetical protein BGZ54_007370 [Gamsiella multidivaricata]|nr:hypothetical protein BGZ54_007370 [Gamsiella multidivaricata]
MICRKRCPTGDFVDVEGLESLTGIVVFETVLEDALAPVAEVGSDTAEEEEGVAAVELLAEVLLSGLGVCKGFSLGDFGDLLEDEDLERRELRDIRTFEESDADEALAEEEDEEDEEEEEDM